MAPDPDPPANKNVRVQIRAAGAFPRQIGEMQYGSREWVYFHREKRESPYIYLLGKLSRGATMWVRF